MMASNARSPGGRDEVAGPRARRRRLGKEDGEDAAEKTEEDEYVEDEDEIEEVAEGAGEGYRRGMSCWGL